MNHGARNRVRKLEKRLSKAEKLVPAVVAKMQQSVEKMETTFTIIRGRARVHTTAVAAIVMWGEPKIDEPLMCAWKRTLEYHGFDKEGATKELRRSILTGLPLDGDRDEWRTNDELRATQKIYPLIVDDAHYRSPRGWWDPSIVHAPESSRFSEVFKTAPGWLLKFTHMEIDAAALEFDLPDLSDELSWGVEAVKDAERWPLLPLGTIAAGGPVCAAPQDGLSANERRFYEEMQKRPKDEWSRFERRRMQQLVKRLSLKKLDAD
jgi:hypothetical protein